MYSITPISNQEVCVSIDCMGGDYPVEVPIGGANLVALQDKNVKFILHGDSLAIESYLDNHNALRLLSTVVHSDLRIDDDKKPSEVIRKAKGTSMYESIKSVKNGEADIIVSGGNTGVLMALSKIILTTVANIDRPALIGDMPTKSGRIIHVLDLGANVDSNSHMLCQFALMGHAYYTAISGLDNCRVALLNIGSEDTKGNDAIRNAATTIKSSCIGKNFIGFIEADKVLLDTVDIVVADGFAGNILLKSIEGTAEMIIRSIKTAMNSNLQTKIASLLLKKSLKKSLSIVNPSNYNGGMMIGLRGICLKSHGKSDALAFSNAVLKGIKLFRGGVNERMQKGLASFDLDSKCIDEL